MKKALNYVLPALLILALLLPLSSHIVESQKVEPLYVIIIWHYHQPWYYNATSEIFVLPWVRMHSVGNYYKMAYILLKYPDIKATFTFSGSLLTQLIDYVEAGRMDYRQIISYKLAGNKSLSTDETFSMLQTPGGFFDINWNRIVNVVPKFRILRDKAQEAFNKYVGLPEEEFKKRVVSEFTYQDLLDLACLFNIFWIDPLILKDEFPELYKVREAYLKDRGYSCDKKTLNSILEAQKVIMAKIIPTYKELLLRKQAEIIPVPYSHPLAPILTAFGLEGDLLIHVNLSLDLFRRLFDYRPQGIWPAELAINEDVLRIFSRSGIKWSIADDTVLMKSAPNIRVSVIAGVNVVENYFWFINFNTTPIYVFFRNSDLSNLVGFAYSTWRYNDAVNDLMAKLKAIASVSPGGLIVIALDGENPWEHYEEFGDLFLQELYKQLSEAQRQGIIRTITPSEYIAVKESLAKPLPILEHAYLNLRSKDISDIPISYVEDAYRYLPREYRRTRIAEGSWAGGELAIWIGQRQENVAWMFLLKTREDLMKIFNAKSLEDLLKLKPKAAKYVLMAEASDWFWWYGGDGGGTFPVNLLFKPYLAKAYAEAGLEIPNYLKTSFNPEGTPIGVLNTDIPKPITKEPRVDGVLNETLWSEALGISIGNRYVREALIAISSSNLALGIKFGGGDREGVRIALYLTNPWRSVSPYSLGYNSVFRDGTLAPMGLFYEILIDLDRASCIVNIANGKEGWIQIFKVDTLAISESLELLIPWHMLSLTVSDLTYIVVVVYKDNFLVERSDRIGLTNILQVPRLAIAPQAKIVFEMIDQENDDDGAGGYRYPLNPVFKPGVFDLTKFKVSISNDKVIFEVHVRNLGGNPWGGPNGFSLQYIHIYIRTTLEEPGRGDTFGLNVNLSDDSRWHMAILIAPGWGSDPVPKGERSAIYYYNETFIPQNGLFKVYVDSTTNAIIAEISKSLLLDVDNVDSWIYTVFLTSYDGYGPMRIRPFGIESQEWVVGAGAGYAQAILYNILPRVMDLLSPTREAQYSMLNTFKIFKEKGIGEFAVVRGVSGAMVVQPITQVTLTVTTLVEVTRTVTTREYMVETIPVTSTVTETSRVDIVAGLLAGFIIGALSSLLLLRRRS